jgi:hypothetical protein
MSLLDVIGSGIGTIVETIAKPFTVAQERKKEVAVRDKEIEKIQAEALVEAAKQGQITQANWDNIALKNSEKSYKDEILMVLMYFPVAALFFTAIFMPEMTPNVQAAVKGLDDFPIWYQILLWGILAHVFGLRWLVSGLVDIMKRKL